MTVIKLKDLLKLAEENDMEIIVDNPNDGSSYWSIKTVKYDYDKNVYCIEVEQE